MNLTFYITNSDPKALTKVLSGGSLLTATMREETQIIDPVFIVETAANPSGYNYCYCDFTGRYYFIRDVQLVRNNVYRISCHVDVLQTYGAKVKQKSATVSRNERVYNGYIPDDRYMSLAYEEIVTKQFPSAMENDSIILMTVG